jgi:hypothetical protein
LGIYIDREQNGVRQQAHGAYAGDHFIIMQEIIQEITELIGRETDKINHDQSQHRADQSQHQS